MDLVQQLVRMLRAEETRMVRSNETEFFRRFNRIPCVSCSPFGAKRGLVYYCFLARWEATASTEAWIVSRQQLLQCFVVIGTDNEVCCRVSRQVRLGCAS